MKGVQAAVLGGSALILLILALRLTLKTICRTGCFRHSGASQPFVFCFRSRFRRG